MRGQNTACRKGQLFQILFYYLSHLHVSNWEINTYLYEMKSTYQRAYLQDFALFRNVQPGRSLADCTNLCAVSGEGSEEPQVQGVTTGQIQQGGNLRIPVLS